MILLELEKYNKLTLEKISKLLDCDLKIILTDISGLVYNPSFNQNGQKDNGLILLRDKLQYNDKENDLDSDDDEDEKNKKNKKNRNKSDSDDESDDNEGDEEDNGTDNDKPNNKNKKNENKLKKKKI